MVDKQRTPRERLGNNLKSPYPDSDNTTWGGILNALGREFDDLVQARSETMSAKFIDDATGRQLEKIGTLLQRPRKSGETDAQYRARLKVELRSFTSGGTADQIIQTAALILDTDPTNLDYSEDFSTEPARFTLTVGENALNNAGVTSAEFADLMTRVSAAGVRPEAKQTGTFTYRSEDDFLNGNNDPARGYYDPNDSIENGTYAGLIT